MKTRFNRFMAAVLALALVLTGLSGFGGRHVAYAAAKDPLVYVTISDGSGKMVVRQQSVTVSDVDGDGAYTVYDALYAAHEKYYSKGGAEAGFAAVDNEMYGLSLTKLWGVENGGSYGYYVDSIPCWNLGDTVTSGSYVDAFIYSDLTEWSDKYSNFNKRRVYVKKPGGSAKLTLTYFDYNAEGGVPVAGATILVNNQDKGIVTNSKGVAKITFDKAGSYMISAKSDDLTLVPPACMVAVAPAVGETITVKNIKYTVTKVPKSLNKKGVVTYSASENSGNTGDVPKTIESGMITYKVKKAK